MASKVIAFGEIGVGILVVAGSATGNLAPMLAALLDPKDLINGKGGGTSTGSTTTKTTTTTSTSTGNGTSGQTPFGLSNVSKNAAGISKILGGIYNLWGHLHLPNLKLP